MKITDFGTAYRRLESEMIVAVLTETYWKHYHSKVYRVVNIVPDEINLQNVNDSSEWLRLGFKEFQSGMFRIEF